MEDNWNDIWNAQMPHKARLAEIVNTFSVKELYNKIMLGRESTAEPFLAKAWQNSIPRNVSCFV
jgi:hypothetical protein